MRVIVDTNTMFSALLNSNGRIGRLLLDSRDKFQFYSCKYLQKEIFRHKEKIKHHSKLDDVNLSELIAIIESRIFFIDEILLPDTVIEKAKEWVADVDFDDFAFVAIANQLDAWLWTGDKKLTVGLRQKGYGRIVSTSDLLDILNM
jgi:predicted nucleic acid-binding protein